MVAIHLVMVKRYSSLHYLMNYGLAPQIDNWSRTDVLAVSSLQEAQANG